MKTEHPPDGTGVQLQPEEDIFGNAGLRPEGDTPEPKPANTNGTKPHADPPPKKDSFNGEGTYSKRFTSLNDAHLKLIKDSGISMEVSRERGYRTEITKARLKSLGFGNSQLRPPALVIPLFNALGECKTHQIRPDQPRQRRDKSGKVRVLKYETPTKSHVMIDIHPVLARVRPPSPSDPYDPFDNSKPVPPIQDVRVSLILTEGTRKTDSAVTIGLCAASLMGVSSWHRLPDWNDFPIKDRVIFIAFDSDAMKKREVWKQLHALKEWLETRGAKVKIIYLPAGPNGDKVGLDDFIAIRLAARVSHENVRAQLFELAADELYQPEGGTRGGKREFLAKAPAVIAQEFVEIYFVRGGKRIVHHWGENFYRWQPQGSFYEQVAVDDVRSAVACYLYHDIELFKVTAGGRAEPVPPTKWHVDNVFDALRSEIHQHTASLNPPQWFEGCRPSDIPAEHTVGVANGILDLISGTVFPANPYYFNLSALTVRYDEEAECMEWLNFLKSLWPDDQESIDCLQEIFGYLLEPTNYLEKIFLLLGPKRSGKGTIGSVLRALLGEAAVASPSLGDFASQFGLEQIIGKNLAIVADARLGPHADSAAAVERMLSISGRGNPGIPRKYKSAYQGRTNTRFLIITNELPMLPDSSGALVFRFVALRMRLSFAGSEDTNLIGKLLPELPGVLHWAIGGWQRLHERGRFKIPDSSESLLEAFTELSNPLSEVIGDCFALKPGARTDKDKTYQKYRGWCASHGEKPYNRVWFFRILNTLPGVDTESRWDAETETTRTKKGERAKRWVSGLEIKL